jgi:hypothetical protein
MSRTALGIIAGVLLFIGGVTAVGGPGGSSAWGFSGVCIKSGLVLGALWLALPQITAVFARMPRTLLGWFIRRKEDSNKTTSGGSPPVRERRPRRRSGT